MGFIATFERKLPFDGIDTKTTGSILLWTNNGDTNFIVDGGSMIVTAASGITVGPTIGLGTSAGVNDVVAAVPILALTTAGKIFNYSPIGMSTAIPPGGTLYANIATASTGTSQAISINTTGYWL